MKNYIVTYVSLYDNDIKNIFVRAESVKDAVIQGVEASCLPNTMEGMRRWEEVLFEEKSPKTLEEAQSNYLTHMMSVFPDDLEGLKSHYFNGDILIDVVEFVGNEFEEGNK